MFFGTLMMRSSVDRRHHALEKIAKDALDLAVDQVIDIELVEAFGALKLPRAGTR